MRAKSPKMREEDLLRRYQDLLEIARLTKDPVLTQDAEMLYQEIQSLESHLEQFEKNMET